MKPKVRLVADMEYRGMHVRVVRDDGTDPAGYAARVYVPRGMDGWCEGYWDRFAEGNRDAMRWHTDNVFGDVSFGHKGGVGYHYTVMFDAKDVDPVMTDAEAIRSAQLFADQCLFRFSEFQKAHVAGASA